MTLINTLKIHGDIIKPAIVEVRTEPGIGIQLEGINDREKAGILLRGLTALQAKGFMLPGRRIIIKIRPLGEPKGGSGYDLAIAVALLVEAGACPAPNPFKRTIFYGALGPEGEILSVGEREMEAEKIWKAQLEGGRIVACPSKFGKKFKNCGYFCMADLGEVIDELRDGRL